MTVSRVKKICLVVFLISANFFTHAQRDTVVIKKDPVVIKREVFYSNAFNPHNAKNLFRLDVHCSPRASGKTNHAMYENISLELDKPKKQFGLSYIRKHKGLEFGLGLGFESRKQSLFQDKTITSLDSMSGWNKDTLDSYFVTTGGVTQEIFVVDSNFVWDRFEKSFDTTLSVPVPATYLRIPLYVGYSFTRKKISLDLGLSLVSNIKIAGNSSGELLNKGNDLEEVKLLKTVFIEVAPQVNLGYNLDVGIGFFVSYKSNLYVNDFTSLGLHNGIGHSFGVGAKYFF